MEQTPETENEEMNPEVAEAEEKTEQPEEKTEEENPLQAELDAANAKTAEYLALAQRVQADFENFRRRNEDFPLAPVKQKRDRAA